jgi:hypothetical protein
MRFESLTLASINVLVLWNVKPYSLLFIYERFQGIFRPFYNEDPFRPMVTAKFNIKMFAFFFMQYIHVFHMIRVPEQTVNFPLFRAHQRVLIKERRSVLMGGHCPLPSAAHFQQAPCLLDFPMLFLPCSVAWLEGRTGTTWQASER